MGNENLKSVKWILLSLNLDEYMHVCIREHGKHGAISVGGGYPANVIRRFGDRLVVDSYICDGALFLYVKPDVQVSDHWGDWCMLGDRFCACAGCCKTCDHPYNVVTMCPLDREECAEHRRGKR